MGRARHDLQIRQQRRGVGRGAALAGAAAVHIHGLAVQVARRGLVAVGGAERAAEGVVVELLAAVEHGAVDALSGQPDVGLAARRAADVGGVGAQHVPEEHRPELFLRDLRLLRQGGDAHLRAGRRGVEQRLRPGDVEADGAASGQDGVGPGVVAGVDHLAAQRLAQLL